MGRVLGIDLGATFSAVAAGGRVISEGPHRKTYSVASEDRGQILIGERALRNGRRLAPDATVPHLLRYLRETAERVLGEAVPDAVITVPLRADVGQLETIRKAAATAGLQVRRFVPSAVAAVYGYDAHSPGRELRRERVLVYDFGGTSFEAALLERDGDTISVLAHAGDLFTGGSTIDHALAASFAARLTAEGYDVPPHDGSQASAAFHDRLRYEAERVKRQLSRVEASDAVLAGLMDASGHPIHAVQHVTRQEMDRLAAPMVERTLAICSDLLTRNGSSWSDIDRVLLVGGSSHMPLVRQLVRDRLGHEPVLLDPDVAAAVGASLLVTDESERRETGKSDRALHAFSARGSTGVRRRGGANKPPIPRSRQGTADLPGTIDSVHFSVTCPLALVPGSTFVLTVWAFLEQQRKEIAERARQAAGGKEVRIQSKGPVAVSRGTVLTVRVGIDGLSIEDADDTILWSGEVGNATFDVRVPTEIEAGSRPGLATIYVDGLRVMKIHFEVEIDASERAVGALPAREERHRKAFLSYASNDRDAVLARVQGLQKALPTLEVFMDVLTLRSGQAWEQELWRVIPKSDVFYLFWSDHARRSEWVEKEWRCALKTRGLDFIDPVPLVSPEDVPPPAELSSKHFGDWVLAFLRRPPPGDPAS